MSIEMSIKTIEQQRAHSAYIDIKEVISKNYESDYRSLVRGFASMILKNGLGQSLAFLKAKKEEHHNKLYEHLNKWIKVHFNMQNNFDLLTDIREGSSYKYRLYSKEILYFLIWLRKFAEAELKEKEE